MAEVKYDGRSFIVNGKRIWLASGSMHYFRIPPELWADRLLKAKRAGLNCICTYLAWNFHEPEEGKWQSGPQYDIAEFIHLAEEMGLYVILRPGPYICAEWDFGGFPAWLTTKSGISYRTSNAAYMHYLDKYFRNILPPLADLQVTRGGNIILIQNENEYMMTTMPDRMNYLEFISQLFRRSGFDIPIITCNWFSDPTVPDAIDCVNTWSHCVEMLKHMRLRQPNAPLLVTEFWAGWFDQWGTPHQQRDPKETARRALEAIGCGAQVNYYMWHGGTNFGFWGSRQVGCSDGYMTTSYDYDAPLAEGGGLTPKYYLTRLVNLFAQYMGPYLADCVMSPPGVNIHNASDALNLSGPSGQWAVATHNGREEIKTLDISLPEGKHLNVSLEPFGATAVPINVRLTSTETLDYCSLMPLGFFASKVLLLHGPAGFEAVVSINEKKLSLTVPEGDATRLYEHENLVIVVVNSDLAQRTWVMDDSLILGPEFVGETAAHMEHPRGATQFTVITFDGKLAHKKIKTAPPAKPAVPKLGPWKRLALATEPKDTTLTWTKLEGPTDLDRLGVYYGYAWYQIKIDSKGPRKRNLLLPEFEDRATLFLNGKRLGVWGRGEGATRKPISSGLKKGTNILTVLADNLGRFNFGPRLGELKGFCGHLYDAKAIRTRKFKVKPEETFSRRIIPRGLTHVVSQLESLPLHSAELDIALPKVTPLYLTFDNLPCHAAVLCNERVIGFYHCMGKNFGDVVLGPELKRGKNRITLLLWGENINSKTLDNVTFYSLSENLSEKAQWAWRRWTQPHEGESVTGKEFPAWHTCSFKNPHTMTPLFLNLSGAHKGQLFLNGHNLGRFWNIGPQQRYYLPSCWLKEQNELILFEEQGNSPAGSKLEFCPNGPYAATD